MLISSEYTRLNKLLHDTNAGYGTSGQRFAEFVKVVSDRLETKDILDYGAGKKTMEKALGFPIQNYDPAVPGLDALPSSADIVVCTEVMEHIEPDCLEPVLNHISSLAKRAVFFSIADCEASKKLPDGRNAHLIIEDMDWWLPRLEQYFHLGRTFDVEGGFVFIGQAQNDKGDFPEFFDIGPPVEMKRLRPKSIYTPEQRCENIRSAILRNLPEVAMLPPHTNTMTAVCYGPSLKSDWTKIKRTAGDIWTTSGAHQFLIDRNIVPMAHVECDPRPHKAKGFGAAHKGVTYFLASASSREMFEAVVGYEAWLYHLSSSVEETQLLKAWSMDRKHIEIYGGTNSGITTISLGALLGYRNFQIFGMDCSFEVEEQLLYWPKDCPMPPDIRKKVSFHGGKHFNEDQNLFRVWVGDRPFVTSPQLMQCAQDFMILLSQYKFKFKLHGDGFLVNLIKYLKEERGHFRMPQLGEFDGRIGRAA